VGVVFVAVVAYLLGSIPVSHLVARRAGVDLRTVGSSNVGATNVLRTIGVFPAVVAALLDIGKGACAVFVAAALALSPAVVALAGVLAVVGHVAPVWLSFRGGKGVATGAGVLAVLAPTSLAAGVVVFAFTVWTTRYVSLGSCVAAGVVVIATVMIGEPAPVVLAAMAIAGLVWVRHRDNMSRLRAGSEARLHMAQPRSAVH
jgi:glycerol-3-phosphate acyltransferase PlsY